MSWFKSSWLLKLAALGCAVLTYFYIHQEIITVDERKGQDPSYKLIKLTAKNLPIKARLAASPPEGYRILVDEVRTAPAHIVVIGPEVLLEEADNAETGLVDVSEHTKTTIKKIPVENVAGIHLTGEPTIVEVTIPIEKIEEKEPAQ